MVFRVGNFYSHCLPPRTSRLAAACESCPAALPSARPTVLHVAPCCSPRVAPYCPASRALLQPARRALLQPTRRALLPRMSRPAALHGARPVAMSTVCALPCSPRRTLPCPAAPPSSAEPRRPARATLPNPSRAALPHSPAPPSCPGATAAAARATAAAGRGAAGSVGSAAGSAGSAAGAGGAGGLTRSARGAAGAGGSGGATGSTGVAAGAGAAKDGQRRSLPLPDDPTPQQLREWVLQRARSGGGGFGFLRTAQRRQQSQQETFSPQVLSELVPQRCVTGSVKAAALGASESATALGASESADALGASESTAALGASESAAAPDASESAAALGAHASPATGPSSAEALHTFTLDSGASRCFFCDCTTLTPLSAPVPVSLADTTGGPVVTRASAVLPCPAVPSGSLSGLHLPTFSTNLVSNAAIQDVWVDTFIPGEQCVAIYSPLAPPPWSPLIAVSPQHALLSPCLWASQVPALPPALACTALPSLRLGAAVRRSSLLRVSSDHCSSADSSHGLEGIHQSFTLLASPQQNGIAERHIGLIMEVARTSMIHAAAPHFLWSFAVQYTAHQLNLWPRVSEPKTSPTLQWTGKVGDASVFWVWGALSLVRDAKASKLSSRTLRCVFLGFPTDAPPWQFYHQHERQVFSSQDVTFVFYTTVFPLRSKRQVVDVLIPWIHTVCLQLRERFGQDLPVLRLHSDRGGEFSNLLRDFCRGEGILQSFTLPNSPQQNGIAECRIGLVMEVARTSMIHAAAPHFLWPFAVRYAAHPLNLWPRVSLPETLPTLHWTGEVGDASVFWFYDPTSRRIFPSHDVTFDESVPFYRLFPYRSTPPPPPPLFLTLGPPPVDPLSPQGPAPSGVPQVDPLPGLAPVQVVVGSGAARGAASGGVVFGGAEPRGAECEGAETGSAEPGVLRLGVSRGAEPQGAALSGGSAGAYPRLSPQQLREWFVRHARLWSGATGAGAAGAAGAGGAGVAARAGVTGGTAVTGPRGAHTRGTGAAGTGGVEGAGAGDPTESRATGACSSGAGGAGAGGAGVGGTGAGGAGVGGPGVGGAGARGAGAVDPGGAPVSPLPAPSPYIEQSGGLRERRELASCRVSPVHTARRIPCSRPPPVRGTHAMTLRPSSVPLRVPLPAPPESSLPEVPDPESDRARADNHTVSRLLATTVTDPSFESAAASALVAELLEFAAACRLD
ncbi:unnamed protein product [Closterium sp. NIES-54]